jgi:hypothetical protein
MFILCSDRDMTDSRATPPDHPLIDFETVPAFVRRGRPDAAAFRKGWDIALDYAGHRRSKTVLRALNGVTTPVFFKGQQIGERRLYDERLTCFLLRHHAARGRDKVHEMTGDVV